MVKRRSSKKSAKKGKKTANVWIQHVKKCQREAGGQSKMPWTVALKECRKTYKSAVSTTKGKKKKGSKKKRSKKKRSSKK